MRKLTPARASRRVGPSLASFSDSTPVRGNHLRGSLVTHRSSDTGSSGGWSDLASDDWDSVRRGGAFLSGSQASPRVVFVKQLVVSLDGPESVAVSSKAASSGSSWFASSSDAAAGLLAEDELDDDFYRDAELKAASAAAGGPKEKSSGLMDEGVQRAMGRFEDYVLNTLSVPYHAPANLSSSAPLKSVKAGLPEGTPLAYGSDLCYAASEAEGCFHLSSLTPRSFLVTLTFSSLPASLPASSMLLAAGGPASSPASLGSLSRAFSQRLQTLPLFAVEGVTVRPQTTEAGPGSISFAWGADRTIAGKKIGEMRSTKWVLYAFVALVMRFWALAVQADSADIFIVLLGYVLMHATFVRLVVNMRRMGSNFWLPGMTIISSVFAFLVALLAASLLGVTVDPICLSEALPFLVITVGFDKPFTLAQAVFTSPDITPVILRRKPVIEPGSNDELATKPAEKLELQYAMPVSARDIAVAAVGQVGPQIVRDYALEVSVLVVGALSGVGGLTDFCKLAALILVADCAFLFNFYVSILTILVEVHRIKLMRGLNGSSGSMTAGRTPLTVPSTPTLNGNSTNRPANGAKKPIKGAPPTPTLLQRAGQALFGTDEGGVGVPPTGKKASIAHAKLFLVRPTTCLGPAPYSDSSRPLGANALPATLSHRS